MVALLFMFILYTRTTAKQIKIVHFNNLRENINKAADF